jgi:hypothetical protein
MASLSALDRGRSTTAHSTSQTTVPSSSTGTTPPRASCQSSRPFVGTRTFLIWIWSSRGMTNLACPRTREIGASSLHIRPPLQLSFPPWQSRTNHVHRSPSVASPTRYAPPPVLRQVVPAHASAPHGAPPRPPPLPTRYSWTKLCAKYNGGTWQKPLLPPAIFASTVHRAAVDSPWLHASAHHGALSSSPQINRAAFDLPWLDFAWFFPRRPHKLRTPPWSELHGELVAAGTLELACEIELAMRSRL